MASPRLSSALVTASYWKDLERFRLVAESVERWVPAGVRHYVFVTSADLPLFRPFENSRTTVVAVEDLLPHWLVKLPWRSPFWLSLRSGPVKNWVLQQIVKLSIPGALSEDVLYHLDSDTFFVNTWDPSTWVADGRAPFYVDPGNRGLLTDHIVWHDASARLLGLPELHDDDRNYVGQLVPWHRAVALETLARVESVHGRPWQQMVAKQWRFSEYTLYGAYAERVLADDPRLRPYATKFINEYWESVPLDESGLRALREHADPRCFGVLIQSKSQTPVELIREVYGDLL